MSNEIISQDWYQSLIDDIKAALTEGVYNSRWTLIEAYHLVGRRLLEEKEKAVSIRELCNTVAKSLGKQERTIYYAVEFVKKYPDLQTLPEGKNISWHKIVNKYLPEGKEECQHLLKTRQITEYYCDLCHKSWRKDPRESKLQEFTQRDYLVRYLMAKHKLNKVDGTIAENKDYARRCITKFGYEETKKLIEKSAHPNSFWNNKVSSMRDIYGKGVNIGKEEVKRAYYKDYLAKQTADSRWRVLVEGVWKEFAGKPSEIEYR